MKKITATFLCLILLLVLLAGCGSPADSSADSSAAADSSKAASEPSASSALPVSSAAQDDHEPATMLLAAAASLEDSFKNTLIPMFQDLYPWVTVEGTYDSSGKLQTQIEEGLEVSVFMSAANKQMNALVDGSLIDKASVVELLENEIVLIAPIDSDTAIDSFARIVEAETIALGDPESVPVGQYSQEALTSLGVWEEIQSKTSWGTNVTEVLNQVAEGSADVGIVYASDAAQMPDKVKILATAPEGSLEKKVIYPVGILTEAPQREAAELFLEFLQSPEAIAIFDENGFKSNS